MPLTKKISIAVAATLLSINPGAFAGGDRGNPVPVRDLQIAQATTPASAAPAAPHPPALTETFENWNVHCAEKSPAKRCGVSQSQVTKTGQRLLAVEFSAPAGDSLTGIAVLPFGLSLGAGVNLQIDGKPVSQPLRFQTCLPVGCIVPLAFDAATVSILRKATTLEIKGVADGGEQGSFVVSLQGFPAALDRLARLAR